MNAARASVADRIGRLQKFVSRYETGERRLDVVEYVDIARVLGIDTAAAIIGVPAAP